MDEDVAVSGHRGREPLYWAALGIVGGLVPVVPMTVAVLTATAPPLALLLVTFVAWRARTLQGSSDVGRLRWWTFQTWAFLGGLWVVAVMLLILPPGTDPSPPTSTAWPATLVAFMALIVSGSTAIALGSHLFARRVLAGAAPAVSPQRS